MTAISVTWTAKDAARLDPGKPITTGLKNDEWDNLTFLAEWLGADYLAGAVQNHDHDGVNSAPIEALPNLIKNGSFERDGGGGIPAGWTFTPYTGGSAAMVTASQAHGRTCVGITSTVLANGGGYYESANFIDVGGGEDYLWKIWRKASTANISSKAEIVWYDAAEAQISIGTLYAFAATETSFTEARGRVTAPATARLAKLRLTGGVPGSGAAVGTVYFDGLMVPDFPRIDTTSIQPGGVGQAAIAASAVGQSQLKSTIASQSLSIGGGVTNKIAPAGGTYTLGWFAGGNTAFNLIANGGTYEASVGFQNNVGSASTAYLYSRYIQGSRPYNMGDGDIPLFVFVMLDSGGNYMGTYAAPEAPWHNHGPTEIRADYYDADGRGWRWQDVRETDWVWDADANDYEPRINVVGREQIEITQAIKQADMPLFPHPFMGYDLTGMTVVLLDPVHDKTRFLAEMHDMGGSISQLLHDDYLRIDNTPLDRAGPPGVKVVSFRWKFT